MRLFVAIDVTEDIEDYFRDIQRNLQVKGLSLSKHFHITLKFLGEVNEAKLSDIDTNLKLISFEKFKVKLADIGSFPRVVFVGTEKNESLMQLQTKIINALPSFPDDHSFHPHFILARIKPFTDKLKLKDVVKSIKTKEMSFPVSEFKLKKSELTPSGPIYTDLFICSAKDL